MRLSLHLGFRLEIRLLLRKLLLQDALPGIKVGLIKSVHTLALRRWIPKYFIKQLLTFRRKQQFSVKDDVFVSMLLLCMGTNLCYLGEAME